MGFLFLAGVVYMAPRRGLRRPARLDYRRGDLPAASYSRKAMVEGDWVFLGFLAAILVTAYLLTGLRILGQHMAWFTVFTPFGRSVAEALSGLGMTPAEAVSTHTVLWWIHVVLALGFVAYLPYSKAMHLMLDGVNLLASDRTASLRLPAPAPGHAGYEEIGDFTWKELLDLDACTRCGRCHEVCPARQSGAPLSPRELILDLRQWMDTSTGGRTLFDREKRPEPTGPLTPAKDKTIAGGVIDATALWSCTTCMACVEACPVGIEHVPTIVELRRTLVDSARWTRLQQTLQNLGSQGNSFGKSSRQRARWTRGLPFEIPDARKTHVAPAWFIGDYASFDERLADSSAWRRSSTTPVSTSACSTRRRANAGNDVRRVGEEGLFELLAEHNLEALAGATSTRSSPPIPTP